MLLNGARSAPEAKFLPISSKSSKVPKLMQLRRILKIFKSLGLPAFKPSKHILKFENPPKPQKFSNLRIVLNPRGRPRGFCTHTSVRMRTILAPVGINAMFFLFLSLMYASRSCGVRLLVRLFVSS
jgi:hypothetical protein